MGSVLAVLGVLRLTIALLATVLTTLLILITALLPIRIRGVRLAAWFTTWAARVALGLFNIHLHCAEPDVFWQHRGFIFANHISYVDILVLQAIMPLRYLSQAEVRGWLFIGWVALAIETVFVDRRDRSSRLAARRQLAETSKFPPLVLFPEGGIGPANSLQSFRYGAFEIAIEGRISYLLAAIRYSRAEVVEWKERESFLQALWRLACHPGPIQADVLPLRVVAPKLTDTPKKLALEAHHTIAEAMNVPASME